MPRRILYIAPTLPILTCTFIYREIFDLRDMGFEIDTISMNTPPLDLVSEEARKLLDTTLFLDQVHESYKFAAFLKALIVRPSSMIRCLTMFFTATPMQSFRDYLRLGYHLIEACYLAFKLRGYRLDHIHSHFITGTTSIGMFLSELLKVPFSFTMHASLIWVDPLALVTKLEKCAFCVSISEFNKQHVVKQYGSQWERKIHIVHCGIVMPRVARLCDQKNQATSILAVGQLVKRKGFHVLVQAAKILRDSNVDLTWTIVGDGDQRPLLEKMISDNGLEKIVSLVGAQPHEAIPHFLSKADVFALPCVIGEDSTRDGIPVALMEAMAYQLPVVSTDIVGLPELIESGRDGVLVASGSASALAAAIKQLAESPKLRTQMGIAAAQKVDRDFNSKISAKQLAALFDSSSRGNPN
jgi:glycosyltransferase involved in cell wall biosynthesis